jgi:hypothetical protein
LQIKENVHHNTSKSTCQHNYLPLTWTAEIIVPNKKYATHIYMYKNIIIIHLILHVDKSLPLKWTAEIVPNKIYVTAKKKGIAEKWLSTCIETKNLILHNSLPLTWTAEMVPDKKYLLYQKKGELCHWRGLQSLSLIKNVTVKKRNCREINIYMYRNKTSNATQFSATEVDCRDCP